MALSDKQLKTVEAVRKDMQKVANFPIRVGHHGMPGDILRINVETPTKFVTKEQEKAIEDVLKKHKLKKIKRISIPAIGAGVSWQAFDA